MSRRLSLTAEEAKAVKAALWNGQSQAEVATERGVSQATISRIQRGESWELVPWPNGETGPIPHERLLELARARNPRGSLKGIIQTAAHKGVDLGEIAEKIREMVEAKEAEEERGLVAEITRVPEKGRAATVEEAGGLDPVTDAQWQKLVETFTTHPLVKEAEKGDHWLQTATFYVLTAEGADKLTPAQLRNNIARLMGRLVIKGA